MNTDDKILEFLARAETRPTSSKLDPYHDLIRGLRQRRWTYQEIATALRDEFGVSAAPSTIHAFNKVRAKRRAIPAVDRATIEPNSKRPKPRFRMDA